MLGYIYIYTCIYMYLASCVFLYSNHVTHIDIEIHSFVYSLVRLLDYAFVCSFIAHVYVTVGMHTHIYATPSDLPFVAFIAWKPPNNKLNERKGAVYSYAIQQSPLRHLRRNCCTNAEPPAKAFEAKLLYSHPWLLLRVVAASFLLSQSFSMTK